MVRNIRFLDETKDSTRSIDQVMGTHPILLILLKGLVDRVLITTEHIVRRVKDNRIDSARRWWQTETKTK